MSFRSPPVSLKSGAFAPTVGSSPFVWIGFPLSVIWAMGALPPRRVVGCARHVTRPTPACSFGIVPAPPGTRAVAAAELEAFIMDRIRGIGRDPALLQETLRQCEILRKLIPPIIVSAPT